MKGIWKYAFILTAILVPSFAAAKDDWQMDLHAWVNASQTDPACKVRYVTGIYRPDLGDKPVWGMYTEKMFKYFSGDGARLAPSVCPVNRENKDKAQYRFMFSLTPMTTASQTTHGSETRTTSQPFSANVNYSDGTTATVQGEQTSTVVVPTETTISKSSVALYMYAYRADGSQLQLIGTDSVVFSRVAASGSGANAAGAEMGAGIGNIIRASKDRHRADKLFEEAVKAAAADESTALRAATVAANQTPNAAEATASAPPQARVVPAAMPQDPLPAASAQLSIASDPPGADIEIDGNFIGSTPSNVGVAAGQHQISIKESGFKPWQRKMSVSSGQVSVNATLESDQK